MAAAAFAAYAIWTRTRDHPPARHTHAPARHTRPPESPSASTAATLAVTVTGPACQVFVRVPGGDILVNRNLVHGESVRFDDPRLSVVLSDAGAVRVYVNGKPRQVGNPGQRVEFTAVKQ
jgi:hypothetical protein